MQKVSRSIFTGLLVIAGLTACGDKVTVAPNNTSTTAATPVVHSVTVTPSSVSLSIGQSIQLVASVNADAGLARTVTWASTGASIATVSATGLVNAVGAGTVAITATSTADATQSAAATIIVAASIPASVSISSINQTTGAGSVPANLANVAGQLDVTVNLDPGSQTVTALYLIATNAAGTITDTVATYTGSALSVTPAQPIKSASVASGNAASASVSPITMSFNTGQFNATSGAVLFLNGGWTIKASASVSTGAAVAVSSTISYTVNNADFLGVLASATNTASDANGLAWIGGTLSFNVVPVLYSGQTLKTVTVTPPIADAVAAAQTVTTFPTTVTFSAGTKDTLTYNPWAPTFSAVYSSGAAFAGATTTLTGSLASPIRVDWQAPAQPTVLTLKGGLSHWLGASYAFGNATDYAAANGDPGLPSTPGVGKNTVAFWVFPKASFTALSGVGAIAPNTNVGSASKCTTTGGTAVTAASQLANSAPNDSTTYRMRVLQTDKVGNVVCSDLPVFAGAANFGVDLKPPVSAQFTGGVATNAGVVNPLLAGSNVGYNNTDFTSFTPTAVDSISGFNLATDVTQTVKVNDVTVPGTTCSVGTPANGCTVQSGAGVTFPSTGTLGINDEGYYTIGATIADRAGNAVALPGTVIAIDRTAPVGSGGVAIPAALVGGTAISLTETITDNMTLMGGGGSVQYASGLILNYDASSSFSPAGVFGTLNKTGTATLGVPWLISAAQPGIGAVDAIAQFNLRGRDEVGLSGGNAVVVPGANITTGAGTGAGANGIWTAANFSTFAVTNAAKNISIQGGHNATSVALTANVAIPPAVGLPFAQVCFFYQNPNAVTTNAVPTFQAEYVSTGLCVSTAATSDNTNWVYTSAAWTPPATLPLGAVNVIAIGYGVNGHASYTAANANITLTP